MGRSGTTFAKRQKELARMEKAKERDVRRQQRREKGPRQATGPGEDPDLAGIVAGPQPPAED